MENGVSVIICCFNGATRIVETLKYLFRQETPHGLKWEIVLVDNASSDNSKEIAIKTWKELGRTDVPLMAVDQPVQGLSFARAMGVLRSRYDIVIFCDDDNWLEANYVTDAFSLLNADHQIGAIGGTGLAVSDAALPSWFDQYRFCFACFPQGDADGILTQPLASLYGAGMVVRKAVLKKLEQNKFKALLTDRIGGALASGGDTELSYAIRLTGYQLGFSSRLKFYHYMPSARLTEQYLIKLNESLAFSSGTLILYRYVLLGKSMSRLVWFKDAVYQFGLFCKSLIIAMSSRQSDLERKLALGFSFNSMKSIFIQFGAYRLRYQQIQRLRAKY